MKGSEREMPKTIEEAEVSHLARYKFAQKWMKAHLSRDINILDAPCGAGYGSALMSEDFRFVNGVDVSQVAIEHAKSYYGYRENIIFEIRDIEKQILGQYDVIVSFEGIEHLLNPNLFLYQCHLALRDRGFMIISTPRKPHGSPFHVIEFNLEEFYTILYRNNFQVLDMFGQTYDKFFSLRKENPSPFAYHRFNYIAICQKV